MVKKQKTSMMSFQFFVAKTKFYQIEIFGKVLPFSFARSLPCRSLSSRGKNKVFRWTCLPGVGFSNHLCHQLQWVIKNHTRWWVLCFTQDLCIKALKGGLFKVMMIPKVAQNSIQGSFRLGYVKKCDSGQLKISLLALRHCITNPNRATLGTNPPMLP